MKKISVFLICILFMLQMLAGMNVFAAEISGNVESKPVDMVVVVDTSGSMNYSDSTHLTAPAIKMLINMIPAENSRLGIVTFNTKPTALTCDAEGNPALLSLKEFENVKNIKQKVSEIAYKSDTGIGNAIKMATDILAEHSKDKNRQKAILLFTDGVDDFPGDQLGLARCKENQGTAVQWATENNCPIYCIGYNYKTASGETSMGKAGFEKLSSISKSTKGKAQAITSIKQIEDMFIKMVAEIYSVVYIPVDVIPGDGLRHEVTIPISPEVIEANVRITCPTKEAISKGKIELYNPQNQQIPLQNNGGVRYDVDATAASIKVLSPKTGTWKLVLEGIKGEEIKIGLLEHYELGIVSKLTLPKNNPKDVAYVGDTIGVQTSLTTDGKPVADKAIYETVKDAKVVVVPRANPKQQKTYALTFDGNQYTGSFSIPIESAYDVTVEIASDSFIRSDSLVIKSSNHPLVLNKRIENVKLNKNKQLIINDIYTYVSDPENDKITAEVTNSTDPDMANAVVKDDTIVIDGLKWGATSVTVTYTDAHGNTVESTFKVSVNDPVMLSVYIGIFVLIVILVLLFIYWLYRKTFRITGQVRVVKLAEAVYEGGLEPKISEALFESSYSFDLSNTPQKPKFGRAFGSKNSSVGGGFGAKNTGFGTQGGFGAQNTGFGAQNTGFGAQNTGFGAKSTGFGVQGSGFGPKADTTITPTDTSSTANGIFGTTTQEKENELIDDSKFDGKMELGYILGNERNLHKILSSFSDKYEKYMTNNGANESPNAKKVKAFIGQLAMLKDAKIIGSSMGLKGILIKLPKRVEVKSHSLKIQRFKIKTNINGGKFVVIKLSVPCGEKQGKQICQYFEIEYKN